MSRPGNVFVENRFRCKRMGVMLALLAIPGVRVWAQNPGQGATQPGAQAPAPPATSQTPTPPVTPTTPGASATAETQQAPASAQATDVAVQGGTISGTVTAGSTPLPGVSITATNTLTGTHYVTATGINGTFRLHIPENGRYVLRTDFAAFAETTAEVRFGGAKGGPRDVTETFALTLSSRVPAQAEDRGALGTGGGGTPGTTGGGARTYDGASGGRGAGGGSRGGAGGSQLLELLGAATGTLDAGDAPSGTSLPSLAGNSNFASDSVAVQGQSGGNAFAGIDFNALRDRAEGDSSLNGGGGRGGPGGGGGFGGGGFGGGGGGFGGGGGGFGGSLRHFNPNQPHGAFFWGGSNSALNARDYALRGQPIGQPNYGSNRYGLVYAGTPYIPRLLTHDKKDFLFFTVSGQRSSSPFDQYGTVPTAAERNGNFSGFASVNGATIPIYDPATGRPFANNVVPGSRIAPQATALLSYLPLPNLPGTTRNYQRLTSAQSNSTVASLRLIHSFGGSGASPLAGLIRQYLGTSTGLQQNVHVNYNYTHTASDNLNLFAALGGKTQVSGEAVELGYALSKGKLSSNLNLDWNRSTTNVMNSFTNTNDVASGAGLNIFNGQPVNPFNYGLPNITLTQYNGFAEQQPSFQTNQTISLAESSAWTHGKHNVKWGGDFKRVHLNLQGSGRVLATGSFIFSGLFTQQPGSSAVSGVGNTTQTGLAQSGSSLADLLLGLPQQTSIQAPYAKSYLRENVYDAYLQDDWRALPAVTLQFGLRYEYFSPYAEKTDRLATLDPGNNFTSVATVTPNAIGPYTGAYPRGLIYPERNDFSPRVGFAWRAAKDTVVRGGYGINFSNGQYSNFVQQFAFQPPFADVQTNEAIQGATQGAQLSLANGFPAPQGNGNYAVNKNYRLPYVQVWNLSVQRTLPSNIVLNVGYNGSKGTRLSIVDAPGRSANASLSGTIYDYESSVAYSNFNSLAVSLRKRLQKGLSLQATYTYGHSIDNATSVGGVGNAVAQDALNLRAEESNSSFDVRHKVSGNFVYELPFGADKTYFTAGRSARLLEGISASGTYTLASGVPLTPSYVASINDVARGSAGSQRPDRVPGVSLASGGNVNSFFNTAAFTAPAGEFGNASRYSIAGPGTVSVNGSVAKTVSFGDTRSFEVRATADNLFNTIHYSSVDTQLGSESYGQVIGTAPTRQFTFIARFRY